MTLNLSKPKLNNTKKSPAKNLTAKRRVIITLVIIALAVVSLIIYLWLTQEQEEPLGVQTVKIDLKYGLDPPLPAATISYLPPDKIDRSAFLRNFRDALSLPQNAERGVVLIQAENIPNYIAGSLWLKIEQGNEEWFLPAQGWLQADPAGKIKPGFKNDYGEGQKVSLGGIHAMDKEIIELIQKADKVSFLLTSISDAPRTKTFSYAAGDWDKEYIASRISVFFPGAINLFEPPSSQVLFMEGSLSDPSNLSPFLRGEKALELKHLFSTRGLDQKLQRARPKIQFFTDEVDRIEKIKIVGYFPDLSELGQGYRLVIGESRPPAETLYNFITLNSFQGDDQYPTEFLIDTKYQRWLNSLHTYDQLVIGVYRLEKNYGFLFPVNYILYTGEIPTKEE